MLGTSQYQPRLSSITNVAPGGSDNQIAVFTRKLYIINGTIKEYFYDQKYAIRLSGTICFHVMFSLSL